MKKCIKIIDSETDECINEIDVSKCTTSQIQKIDNGLNINLNHDKYYTLIVE